ncbi:MAG: DUF445 domain-containing protein [Pyrinomonadaceae bacterium]
MLLLQDIAGSAAPFLKNIWVQIALLIVFATLHGYAGAWLAVRMLFRPRRPVRLFGLTVFPQGMIPRHRDRLANAIGKAVGEELVSHDTILEQLTANDFLRKRVQGVIDSYTDELLSQNFPSLIDALPRHVREPVLDAISALQRRIAEHIDDVLKSEESLRSITGFVEQRVDEALSRRVSSIVDDEMFDQIARFIDERVEGAVTSPVLEQKIADFIDRRVDDLAKAETSLGAMFTSDAVALLKEKASDQISPVTHHLTEIAAAERTRSQIGALIKREVHEYYENLPFFKKIFVSRENLLREVDTLVNESLPRRIEETLKGDFFAGEARDFIDKSIDNALSRPLQELIGKIDPDQLARLKAQMARGVLSVVRGEEMRRSIAAYITETIQTLRPHSIDSIMRRLHPEAEEKLKSTLAKGLVSILSRDDTSKMINDMLSRQIDRLLSAPIGRVGDQFPEDKVREASRAVTEAIVSAVHAKLPDAVREFNVGAVVREKINNYPEEKLEALVLSVAKEHLRTIEFFGALFGLFIGILQAIQFYIYAR